MKQLELKILNPERARRGSRWRRHADSFLKKAWGHAFAQCCGVRPHRPQLLRQAVRRGRPAAVQPAGHRSPVPQQRQRPRDHILGIQDSHVALYFACRWGQQEQRGASESPRASSPTTPTPTQPHPVKLTPPKLDPSLHPHWPADTCFGFKPPSTYGLRNYAQSYACTGAAPFWRTRVEEHCQQPAVVLLSRPRTRHKLGLRGKQLVARQPDVGGSALHIHLKREIYDHVMEVMQGREKSTVEGRVRSAE